MKGKVGRSLALILSVVLMFSGNITSLAQEEVPLGTEEWNENDSFLSLDREELETFIKEEKIVENQLIVMTNDGEAVGDKVEKQPEDIVTSTIRTEDIDMVVVETTEELADKIEEYENDPAVEYVQPNYIYTLIDDEISTQATTDDNLSYMQWHLSAIGVMRAWDYVRTQKAIRVAVIDSGVDGMHEDLSANINKSLSYDLITGTNTLIDINGHGTHVAGIIAGVANNKHGIAGVSYNAELLSYRVTQHTDQGEVTNSSYIADAINRGVNAGARVINISLGGYYIHDNVLEKAVNSATERGVVVVCAGGNGLGGQPQTNPIYPADYEACISVVATNQYNGRDNKFDYNQYKDIAAPGIDITSTVYKGGYAIKTGTSMASPMVAGVIALMLSAEPNLSVNQVKNILYNTATDLGISGRDDWYGHGLIQADKCVKQAYATTGDSKGKTTGGRLYYDVANNAWYTKPIRYVTTRGIMTGTNPGATFDPGGYMVRAHLTQTLYNLEGQPSAPYRNLYPDVPRGEWYTNSIIWASNKGVVSGYDTGKFGPGDKINREQLAVMLFRYAKSKGWNTSSRNSLSSYPDRGQVSDFAKEAMQWAVAMGIITGDNGRLNPKSPAPRAQCATMLMRFLSVYGQ